MRNNTVAVLRGARGRPQPPRLSSTLTSGSRVPSASSVGWSAEARECGSSLLHARTSREAKKKTKMPSIGEEREAGEEKGNRASRSVPSASEPAPRFLLSPQLNTSLIQNFVTAANDNHVTFLHSTTLAQRCSPTRRTPN